MTPVILALLCASPQDDREGVRTVHQSVHRSFVAVEIRLRKKSRIERAELQAEALDAKAQRFLRLMENDQVFETWGVAVGKDLVLMPDHGLRDGDVAELTMRDSTGERFGGVLHGIGRRHDFMVVKAAAPHPLVPLSFSPWTPPALGESFYVTYATRVDARWHLNVSPYILTNEPLVKGSGWFCIDPMRPGSVISDREGKTVGIALDEYLWRTPDGRSSFLGPDVLSDERVTDLPEKYAAFRDRLARVVKRVEMTFRADGPAPRFMPRGPAAPGRTVLFGIPIDARGTLLVPAGLSRDQIRKIEDIRVVEAGRAHPAAFVGAFRDFEAMLVRAEDLPTAPGLVRSAGPSPPGELFFTATVENRFGRNRIKLRTNRLYRVESGLRGAPRTRPSRSVKAGSFVLDFNGRVVGFATHDKKREDLDEMASRPSAQEYYMSRYRRQYRSDYLRHLVFSSEIVDVLKNPRPHFDPAAVPMTKKEEKRQVWLGVEVQAMSKPLAESLGVEERDLTNDGRRGLIVTEVYAGSPAARAGIRLDDVLLAVRPPEEAPRDLVARTETFGFRPRSPRSRSTPPWKPTQNYLTRLLTEIGAGKEVSFDLLRGRKTSAVKVALEDAPRDFETAEKLRDEEFGVTLKDLTYEVRRFQRIPAGTSGVVVAKVESGSRAEVAKLQPHSVVTRVNNVPVRDVAHFKALLAAPGSLTLTTITYGQTKLVELARD